MFEVKIMRRTVALWPVVILLFLGTAAASAQTFQFRVQQGATVTAANEGSVVPITADGIGRQALAMVTALYQGTAGAAISDVRIGGTNFALAGVPALPQNLTTGQSIAFAVIYTPTATTNIATQLTFQYTEGTATKFATLNLNGTTSDLSVGYVLPTDNNFTPLASGGRLLFPPTNINSTIVANVIITNRGSGAGTVNAISGTGTGFQLQGLPALPTSIEAGGSLRFNVAYSPRQAGVATGSLQIYLGDRAIQVALEGSTATPDLAVSYFLPNIGNLIPVTNNSSISFPATSINGTSTVTVVISNRGLGSGFVNSVAVSGGSYQLIGLPILPATIDSGKDLRFGIVFSPTKAGNDTGILTITLPDRVLVAQITGNTASADFKISYAQQVDGNSSFVESGGRITFPSTKVNATSAVAVSVSNFGAGAGNINSITLTGQGFQLTGLAALPILIAPARELRFGILYSPTQLETATGVLRIGLDDRTVVIDVSGSSTGPVFNYTVLINGSTTPVSVKDTITLPDTPLRETTTVTVQVSNVGNADGTVAGIQLRGDGFQLSNLPIFPAVLAQNASLQFRLTFTPTQAGPATGRLQIGADGFDLMANAQGAKLLYSYAGDAGLVMLQDLRTVLWGRVEVGKSAQMTFTVRNDGTAPATVSSASIVDARSAFRLADTPEFPASVAPGGQISFTIVFTPTAIGDNSARMRVDADTFTLVGSGTAPPTLPAVELKTSSQSVDILQQPSVSLKLASPYPLPLTGTLVLTVNSRSFSVDPAVQFATGGRTVAFTIPANSTQAQFPGGPEIRFQTGTVAATISLAANFATEGGINLAPDSPPVMSIDVPEAAPRVLDLQIDARTTNGFTIVVTGVSTTRTLKQLDLSFTTSGKFEIPGGRFTINVESASSTWYRSAESQAFGSLFTARIPFTLQGLNSSQTISQVFQSISATLTNDKGQSNSVSVTP